MAVNENTLHAGNVEGAENRLATYLDSTAVRPDDQRPRCLRCGHPLTDERSIARSFGPKCWRRTVANQLACRRDAVGRVLGGLARRAARMEGTRLSELLADLTVLRDALDAAEVVA